MDVDIGAARILLDVTTMSNLAEQRFYAAKSEPITAVTPLTQAPVEGGTLMIARVERPSGSDVYQLLLDAAGNDVLATPAVATPLLQALAEGQPAGFGTFHQVTGKIPEEGTPRPMPGEQSNTSLIVGDAVVKFFRRLEPGMNPDVELLVGLSREGCEHIVPVRGWVGYEDYVLAIAQDYLTDAEDAWEVATRADHFTEEARAIGQATRRVHEALATAFPTSSTTTIADTLNQRLDLHIQRSPAVAAFEDQARSLYAQLPKDPVPTQRIHGDLHLGQILRTNGRFVLIDFEGEPAIPLEQRRQPDSTLRDVAGLVRSLDYAGHADAIPALLEGYGLASSTPLLDAFVLDKALYEVAYESNNRPDWVHIPLQAVKRILGE